jgi:hypothetical protein
MPALIHYNCRQIQRGDQAMLHKYHHHFTRSLTALLLLFSFQATAQAQGPDLIQMLTSQLGVSGEQATGGAGALFKYANENLDADDFATIAKGVPEMDQLIDMAPEPENSSALGKASGALGGFDKSLGGMAGLASSFESLGLDADMVSKFLPVVSDYVSSVSGDQAAALLKGLF